MHIHGGGQATSGQSSQDGWKKTSGVCMLFFFKKKKLLYIYCISIWVFVGSHQLVKINIHGVVQFFIGSDNWIHSYFVMPFYVC
jgi:hypothetical protein